MTKNTDVVVTCAQCNTSFSGFEEGQADGCASEVRDDYIGGHYGSAVADLMRFHIDPEKRSLVVASGVICDDCISQLDEQGVFILKQSRVIIDDSPEGKIEALEWELKEAVDLMARVAAGTQTIQNMGEWVSLNFPEFRDKLPKQMQAVPPNLEQKEGA